LKVVISLEIQARRIIVSIVTFSAASRHRRTEFQHLRSKFACVLIYRRMQTKNVRMVIGTLIFSDSPLAESPRSACLICHLQSNYFASARKFCFSHAKIKAIQQLSFPSDEI
jgi:cytochrome c peroxidase